MGTRCGPRRDHARRGGAEDAGGVGNADPAGGNIARIANALERIVELLDGAQQAKPRRRQRREEGAEVSETDRAFARQVARRMGLVVREPR